MLFEESNFSGIETNHYNQYKAPELYLEKEYDQLCDIFSVGVILFILLTGYPPFEQATKKDRWYKSMTKKKYKVFWKAHRASPIAKNFQVKNLLEQMLAYNPTERISISDIKKHKWYNGKTIKSDDLIHKLRNRYCEIEKKRQYDASKIPVSELPWMQGFRKTCRPDWGGCIDCPRLVPGDIDERINCLHTKDWRDVMDNLERTMRSIGGSSISDLNSEYQSAQLKCNVLMWSQSLDRVQSYRFSIETFLSRIYNDDNVFDVIRIQRQRQEKYNHDLYNMYKRSSYLKTDKKSELLWLEKRKRFHPYYVVRITRDSGDEVTFQHKILNGLFLRQCGTLFTGTGKDQILREEEEKDEYARNYAEDQVYYDAFVERGFIVDPQNILCVEQ